MRRVESMEESGVERRRVEMTSSTGDYRDMAQGGVTMLSPIGIHLERREESGEGRGEWR